VRASAQATRTASFAFTVLFLVALLAALSVLLYVLVRAAAEAQADLQSYLLKLAYLDGAALVLTLFIAAGTVVHHWASGLLDPPEAPRSTPHESAWDEAGKRLKSGPPIEPYEKPDDK
jgi:hypothetical protein